MRLVALLAVAVGCYEPDVCEVDGEHGCVTWRWTLRDVDDGSAVPCRSEITSIDVSAAHVDETGASTALGRVTVQCDELAATLRVTRDANATELVMNSVDRVWARASQRFTFDGNDRPGFEARIVAPRGYIAVSWDLYSLGLQRVVTCDEAALRNPTTDGMVHLGLPPDLAFDCARGSAETDGIPRGIYSPSLAAFGGPSKSLGVADVSEQRVFDYGSVRLSVP